MNLVPSVIGLIAGVSGSPDSSLKYQQVSGENQDDANPSIN